MLFSSFFIMFVLEIRASRILPTQTQNIVPYSQSTDCLAFITNRCARGDSMARAVMVAKRDSFDMKLNAVLRAKHQMMPTLKAASDSSGIVQRKMGLQTTSLIMREITVGWRTHEMESITVINDCFWLFWELLRFRFRICFFISFSLFLVGRDNSITSISFWKTALSAVRLAHMRASECQLFACVCNIINTCIRTKNHSNQFSLRVGGLNMTLICVHIIQSRSSNWCRCKYSSYPTSLPINHISRIASGTAHINPTFWIGHCTIFFRLSHIHLIIYFALEFVWSRMMGAELAGQIYCGSRIGRCWITINWRVLLLWLLFRPKYQEWGITIWSFLLLYGT